ncbi:hypothetical protein EXIGLDRAFT_732849 [Exidia glandulosa HHB12029]|uniref:XRRM domain-containing protein n=1 Tax=Exidia glandulosa HHB12029 TaxID=1314781 RepID=A0A166BN07_EXIGL|nr:hypothetical protein EXIGLDRAFT_732849 [Exidia glandulosa HHB12029]
MATENPFVPRSLQPGSRKPQAPPTRSLPPGSSTEAGPSSRPKTPKPPKVDAWPDEDVVLLYEMCLSDYAIWSNEALYNAMNANDGYVSLRLLDKALASVKRPEDTHVAKALRAASTLLDVRVLISQPDRGNWFGRGDRAETGGFELRRKDWPLSHLDSLTQEDWNRRTVYVENLPQESRTLLGVARLMHTLVSSSATPSLVQNVEFPAHAQAKPDEIPRCKGFAFVTFETQEHASQISSAWPWNGNSSRAVSETATSAHKSGLRCISLARWEKLKDEYLEYQSSLVHAATRPQVATPSTVADSTAAELETLVDVVEEEHINDAGYPRNRLVRVLNIPLDSTKTSLRTMFTQALDGEESIDYIDFVKNLDRCHVRLASTESARRLVASLEGDVRAELVQGEQEALYWEKVPEKLRMAAMGVNVPVESKPPRKRQRKG